MKNKIISTFVFAGMLGFPACQQENGADDLVTALAMMTLADQSRSTTTASTTCSTDRSNPTALTATTGENIGTGVVISNDTCYFQQTGVSNSTSYQYTLLGGSGNADIAVVQGSSPGSPASTSQTLCATGIGWSDSSCNTTEGATETVNNTTDTSGNPVWIGIAGVSCPSESGCTIQLNVF